MATVIELLGGECTGKSALATALHSSLGAHVVPEHLRAFVDQHGRTPWPNEQPAIFQEQLDALDGAVAACDADDLVVGDPAALMTAVYSIQYFDDDSLLPRALESSARADLLVWCQPDFPWSADGLHHDGPDARQLTHRIIEQRIVPALPDESLILAAGTLEDRLNKVLAALHR